MRILAAIVIGLSSLNAFAKSDAFQSGITAFKQDDFVNALYFFQQVEAEGDITEQLKFNLGSTYYKLQHYGKAEQYFRPLIEKDNWRDAALFNLGLIAEKQQNDVLAQHYFLQAYQYTSNQTLQELARRKINLINDAWSAKKSQFSASLLYGSDDNAIAFPDELQSNASAVQDNFVELYVFDQWEVNLDGASESYIQGFIYNKAYQDLSSLDVTVVGVSLLREPINHRFNQGFSIFSSLIDNHVAYHQLQYSIWQDISILNSNWKVTYEPSYFIGGDDFDQLDGWRHHFSGARSWRWDTNTLALEFKAEINDRENLEVGSSRYSYSPVRLSIATTWDWFYTYKLNISTMLEFVNSYYSDKNQLEDLDGDIKHKQRRGTKVRMGLEVDYLIDQHWSVTANLEFVNNNENFDFYTYKRNQISVGAIYSY